MLHLLTDEESIASSQEQIERVALALASACASHPGTSVEALSHVLYMVNGKDWICHSDMARARVLAKSLGATKPS